MIAKNIDIRSQGGGYYPPGGYGPGAPPPGGGWGTPPGGAPGPGNPGGWGPPPAPVPPPGFGFPGQPGPHGDPHAQALKKQAEIWLVIAAASFVVCGSCVGIGGAIFCYLAMQAVDQGNIDDAESKLMWGKIITVSGAVLALLALLLYVLVAVVF